MADGGDTIIIKKINKGGHAAHGGAWKVAYADFVTAMMAFFLLLWLLNATEAEKLAGLADYFAPTVGVKDNMGIGFRGGKGALSKGIGADKSTNKGIIFAAPTAGTVIKNPEILPVENELPEEEKINISEQEIEEEEIFGEIENAIGKEFSEDARLQPLQDNINVETTPEGLKIQIIDRDRNPMFEPGNAELKEDAKIVLKKITDIIALLPNYISIIGHTYSLSLGRGKNYTNWELSADRANATRRFLIESGLVSEQVSQVLGKADHEPLDSQNPESILNNRIDIILLRNSLLTRHKKGAPEEVFIDPDAAEKEEFMSIKPKEEVVVEEEVVEEVEEEIKGRDFFVGTEGEGVDYDAIDPSIRSGSGAVTPDGFFGGGDAFIDQLGGEEEIEEEQEDISPEEREINERRRFFEEQLEKELQSNMPESNISAPPGFFSQ